MQKSESYLILADINHMRNFDFASHRNGHSFSILPSVIKQRMSAAALSQSGSLFKRTTFNCKNVPVMTRYDNDNIVGYNDAIGCRAPYFTLDGQQYGKKCHKYASMQDAEVLLNMCTFSCMMDKSQYCCRVPKEFSTLFACCRPLGCCPDQGRRVGSSSRRVLGHKQLFRHQTSPRAVPAVAVAVSVEEVRLHI